MKWGRKTVDVAVYDHFISSFRPVYWPSSGSRYKNKLDDSYKKHNIDIYVEQLLAWKNIIMLNITIINTLLYRSVIVVYNAQ